MVTAIHHVAIRVADLRRSIDFYTEAFGLLELSRDRLASGAQIAFLTHPSGGCQLELIEGLSDHHPGDGLVHHIAFASDDVAGVFARVRALGLTTIEPAPQTLANGRVLFSFRGPDGERLQITSP
jgi:lactoylglutathione lyase